MYSQSTSTQWRF